MQNCDKNVKFVVLTEGYTDRMFLAGLLRQKKYEFSKEHIYNNYNNRDVDWYRSQFGEYVGIVSVHGHDFKECLKMILDSFKYVRPHDIVIVTDNDDSESKSTIQNDIKNVLTETLCKEFTVSESRSVIYKVLCDNGINREELKIEAIFVPWNKTGALETYIIDNIAKVKQEGECVTQYSSKVIDEYNSSLYLTHRRDRVKAKMGVAYSIFEPERSVNSFNKIIEDISWEEFIDDTQFEAIIARL